MPQTNYHLHLKGVVGGYDFDSSYVDFVLGKHKDKSVNVLIDSLGGSVSTALSIASAFANHGNVNVHFVGMNASAATIASLGAKQVTIDSSAMYLVHKCSAEFFKWDNLNADDLDQLIAQCKQMKNDLDKLDGNIASMYARKCKKSKTELLDLMKVGGWLNAQEAKDWGFVDEVTDFGEQPPVLTDAVASAMADAGIPIPDVATVRSSPFASLINALTSLFKSTQPTNQQERTMKADNIAKVLGTDTLDVKNEKATLTTAELQKIDTALADKESTIATLQAEVETLKKKPADTTHTVVDDKGKASEKNEVADYIDTVNNARELFNSI